MLVVLSPSFDLMKDIHLRVTVLQIYEHEVAAQTIIELTLLLFRRRNGELVAVLC